MDRKTRLKEKKVECEVDGEENFKSVNQIMDGNVRETLNCEARFEGNIE